MNKFLSKKALLSVFSKVAFCRILKPPRIAGSGSETKRGNVVGLLRRRLSKQKGQFGRGHHLQFARI